MDIHTNEIYRKARRDWRKQYLAERSIVERAASGQGLWLAIIALVFFVLSMPHTMGVFNRLTPSFHIGPVLVGFGTVAPLGNELGLLYTAYRRCIEKHKKRVVPWEITALTILLFLMSVVVNGVGSLITVISNSSNIQDYSLTNLVMLFGTFHANVQASLVMVPFVALVIPIGALVSGEGLAKMYLERAETSDLDLEAAWKAVQAGVLFRAYQEAALRAGMTPVQANEYARRVSTGRGGVQAVALDPSRPSGIIRVQSGGLVDESGGLDAPDSSGLERTVQRTVQQTSGYHKNMSARDAVTRFLDLHPDVITGVFRYDQIDQLAKESGLRFSRSTFFEVLKERRQANAEGAPEEQEHV